METNRKLLSATLQNTLLVVAIYVGAWHEVEWIGWILIVFTWYMLVMYFAALYLDGGVKVATNAMPLPVVLVFDGVCTYMLIHSNWFVTATAYAISAIVLQYIIFKSKKCTRNEVN